MDKTRIDEIIDRHQGKVSSLIQVLLEIQSENHWLPKEALQRVSEKLQVPLTRVRHIATFYKTFSLTPKGRHEIHVCTGSSCHVRGATEILERVQEHVGIRPGQTSPDFRFSLETGSCQGSCSLGPEMVVAGNHHGKLKAGDVEAVLKDYK